MMLILDRDGTLRDVGYRRGLLMRYITYLAGWLWM